MMYALHTVVVVTVVVVVCHVQRADVEVYLSLKTISYCCFGPSIIQFGACGSRAIVHLIRVLTACDSAEAALRENTRVHAGYIPSSLVIL